MMIQEKLFKKERHQPRSSPPLFGSCGALGAVLRRIARPFRSRLGWPLRYTGPPPGGRGHRIFGDGSSSTEEKYTQNILKIKT